MVEQINIGNGKTITTLSTICIVDLHDLLSNNYEIMKLNDAVEPKGIKNIDMLESAVFRQHTGSKEWLKYSDCFSNCATLIYGIIKNHPFHNGNKRASFLAMIKHLYVNGYVLSADVRHDDIYDLIISIANNDLHTYAEIYSLQYFKLYKKKSGWNDEDVIKYLTIWIKQRVEPKNSTIKHSLKINYLKRILESKGIFFEQNGTSITLYRKIKKPSFIVFSKQVRSNEKTYSLGNSLIEIGPRTIKKIRNDFNLSLKDGVDNNMFYDDDSFIDEELVEYKRIIYRLSKT